MSTTFGERLRDLRNDKNLLQSEFGNLFGLSPSAIGSYERNEREPSYRHLVAFADFFGVSLDYMFCRTDERLTVKDYTAQDRYQLLDLLEQYTIDIDDHTLSDNEKRLIYGSAFGLVFCIPDGGHIRSKGL